ncbi:MAG: membrane protein insertion efficiency factor YidD [candidate division WOR-3 bacterium]
MVRLLRMLIRFYQLSLGTVLPNSCRFHPTCSEYALCALAEHGPVLGTWLALRRILRCHPFSAGGYDPVPRFDTPHPDPLPQGAKESASGVARPAPHLRMRNS